MICLKIVGQEYGKGVHQHANMKHYLLPQKSTSQTYVPYSAVELSPTWYQRGGTPIGPQRGNLVQTHDDAADVPHSLFQLGLCYGLFFEI